LGKLKLLNFNASGVSVVISGKLDDEDLMRIAESMIRFGDVIYMGRYGIIWKS
jgi:ribosomal protein S3